MILESEVENVNIEKDEKLVKPRDVKIISPFSQDALYNVLESRWQLEDILLRRDNRIVVVGGPCSFLNLDESIEIVDNFVEMSKVVRDKIMLIMRVYPEKPRSGPGWQGFLTDPDVNGTFNSLKGYTVTRMLLNYANSRGVPVATEFLDPFTPQYYGGGITLGSLGARSVETQRLRQMASGLSMIVGYKNNTSGDFVVAIEGMGFARDPQVFPGIDELARGRKYFTKGNKRSHIILRGSKKDTNYQQEVVEEVLVTLDGRGYDQMVAIDCSHGNSGKDYRKQPGVFQNVSGQIIDRIRKYGRSEIFMQFMEVNLLEDKQDIPKTTEELRTFDKRTIVRGKSVTDSCVSMDTFKRLVYDLHAGLTHTQIYFGRGFNS